MSEKETKVITGAYGMEISIPVKKVKPHPIEKMPASHGLNECGHHYNIFEPDDGFPQDRFYEQKKEK